MGTFVVSPERTVLVTRILQVIWRLVSNQGTYGRDIFNNSNGTRLRQANVLSQREQSPNTELERISRLNIR